MRIDHKFSDRDSSFYRFELCGPPQTIPTPFESTGGDGGSWVTDYEHNSARSFVLSETHIFSPSFINDFVSVTIAFSPATCSLITMKTLPLSLDSRVSRTRP